MSAKTRNKPQNRQGLDYGETEKRVKETNIPILEPDLRLPLLHTQAFADFLSSCGGRAAVHGKETFEVN